MSLIIDDSAVKRIHQLRKERAEPGLHLRITVDGGGCAGFQYTLELTTEIKDKDQSFEKAILTDDISLPFLTGSTVRFEDELVGSEFVIDNPNATSGCGCGTSFSV